jgi:superfamily II DNA or RNA helicase
MTLKPRWYQEETVARIMEALIQAPNTHPVAAIVTGGGKSLIAAMIVQALFQRWAQYRVLILAPSMELVRQNVEEAKGFLPPALGTKIGVYCAGLNARDRLQSITFATPQSFANASKYFVSFDVVIVDEAHTFDVDAKIAKKIVDTLRGKNPHVRFVGLTGTDFRMQGLKVVPLTQCGLFDTKVIDLTSGRNFNRLLREGYLSQVVAPPVRFPQIETDGIRTKGGDFDEVELAKRAMNITQQCVDVALEQAKDRLHCMWFAVNIAHAQMIQKALQDAGEASVIIHGELDKADRVDGVEAYLKKEHRHIVSVAMLTTGFNAKFVDCIVCLRPTRSLVLWRQIVGRGFRTYDGKENCLVLDAGGNFARHGAINEDKDNADSRAGMWVCSGKVVINPHAPKGPEGQPLSVPRETSALRFRMHSPVAQADMRQLLNLPGAELDACGFWNDGEHLTCRQCSRPRQGYLSYVQARERGPNATPLGDNSDYVLHDEDAVLLADHECADQTQLSVHEMHLEPADVSTLQMFLNTDQGVKTLRMQFDRDRTDPGLYAFMRKLFKASTGRDLPGEPHRALLMRGLITKPIDITLTKYKDSAIYITEIRFLRDGQMSTFRYDPNYKA